MKIICTVYKTRKKEGMYLYVDKKEDISRVPEALLEQFGKPELAMTMLLSEQRTLQRADISKVMQNIVDKGYYLQMPELNDDYMSKVHQNNNKMPF